MKRPANRRQGIRQVSPALARRIREEYWRSRWMRHRELAERYHVSVATIHRICSQVGVYAESTP